MQPHLHARRLQITGAPVSASAPELERLLNRAMRAAGLSTALGAPVVTASVRPADRSAHIEFATPADAANAFALDGLMCRGMRLRLQRPPTFDLAKVRHYLLFPARRNALVQQRRMRWGRHACTPLLHMLTAASVVRGSGMLSSATPR